MSAQDFTPSSIPVWKAGLLCRCPRCGVGQIFKGILKVKPHCDVCALDLRKEDSGDGPAVFVMFILGFVLGPLLVFVELAYEPPFWVHLVLWPPLTIGLTLLTLRPLKAWMIALQYRYHASDTGTVSYDE